MSIAYVTDTLEIGNGGPDTFTIRQGEPVEFVKTIKMSHGGAGAEVRYTPPGWDDAITLELELFDIEFEEDEDDIEDGQP